MELGGVTRYVKRSDIVYVEAQRDYVRLHTRTAGHLVRVRWPIWRNAGRRPVFLRVHRRYLVNAAYVEGLRTAGGRLTVDLGGAVRAGESAPHPRGEGGAGREAGDWSVTRECSQTAQEVITGPRRDVRRRPPRPVTDEIDDQTGWGASTCVP